MTISATIIEDSISEYGKRLTTFLLRYPRFIHAELMTHRVFSRNASSSRAIPVHKLIADIERDPAMPVFWGSNKPGMQAGAELIGEDLEAVRRDWLSGMHQAIGHAQRMIDNGLHKQIANRILEPWAHINVVVTATEYANWFALRNHPDAQPEIRELALEMRNAMELSEPKLLKPGEWHLPFVKQTQTFSDWVQAHNHITQNGVLRLVPSEAQILDIFKKVSVARCARTSFLTHEGKQTTVAEDFALYERLLGAQPLHASPSEHQATPDESSIYYPKSGKLEAWCHPELHGNFTGWIQFRKTLSNEYVPG